MGGSLGSGQFGVVSRGKWQTAVDGSVEVAIKTLRPSAKETDKVKFLQEAAINGQFRHPNIVQLHGVVTVGEPVCVCMFNNSESTFPIPTGDDCVGIFAKWRLAEFPPFLDKSVRNMPHMFPSFTHLCLHISLPQS